MYSLTILGMGILKAQLPAVRQQIWHRSMDVIFKDLLAIQSSGMVELQL